MCTQVRCQEISTAQQPLAPDSANAVPSRGFVQFRSVFPAKGFLLHRRAGEAKRCAVSQVEAVCGVELVARAAGHDFDVAEGESAG